MSSIRQTPVEIVRANGLDLAFDTFGEPGAEPLVLIMGLGTQMIAWDEDFCRQLAARGHYVIRFDNRDVGLSTWLTEAGVPDLKLLFARSLLGRPIPPASVPYTLADMAHDTVGLLDALGMEQAHVAGASLGGAIAQEVAMLHPQRTRSLISIMATSGARDLPPPRPAALATMMQPLPTDRASYIARAERLMKMLRVRPDPAEEALDAARAIRAFERGLNPAGFVRQMAAMTASGSRRRRLRQVQVPTLVIHGEADPLIPIAAGVDVARNVPGARLVRIPGMGHALPRSVWPPIIDAIAEHTASLH